MEKLEEGWIGIKPFPRRLIIETEKRNFEPKLLKNA